ncbi:MAG: hypothetical protein JWO02_4455 [Solirubrobacterales bacterium]|nr:hypothetical protein [Solirubrobacterales bacterium]
MDDGAQEPAEDDGLRDRLRRLRWRMSGAWGIPTFLLATLAGTVIINLLPIAGQSSSVVGAFLLCGFANLVVLGAIAPIAGWWLRRLHPELPRAVAADRAGTGLMVGLLGGLVALGVAHHGSVVAAGDADARQLQAVRDYLRRQAPPEYVQNIGNESVWKQSDVLNRTCVPGNDPRKHLCVYADLSGPTPTIRVDPDQQPNSVLAGPDNPGRQGR